MNNVLLQGNLAKDAEISVTTTGKEVAKFTVATNERFFSTTGSEVKQTAYINCVAWGEKFANKLRFANKGKGIFVSGRLVTRSYEDQNNNKRYITEVVASFVEVEGTPISDEKPSSNFTNFGLSEEEEQIPF